MTQVLPPIESGGCSCTGVCPSRSPLDLALAGRRARVVPWVTLADALWPLGLAGRAGVPRLCSAAAPVPLPLSAVCLLAVVGRLRGRGPVLFRFSVRPRRSTDCGVPFAPLPTPNPPLGVLSPQGENGRCRRVPMLSHAPAPPDWPEPAFLSELAPPGRMDLWARSPVCGPWVRARGAWGFGVFGTLPHKPQLKDKSLHEHSSNTLVSLNPLSAAEPSAAPSDIGRLPNRAPGWPRVALLLASAGATLGWLCWWIR